MINFTNTWNSGLKYELKQVIEFMNKHLIFILKASKIWISYKRAVKYEFIEIISKYESKKYDSWKTILLYDL